MAIINKIKEYLDKVGDGVEDYSYKIIFDGVQWQYQIEGTSIDGEEEYREGYSDALEELFEKIKEEI